MTGGGGAWNHYGLTKGPHKGMKMTVVPRHSGLEPESRGRGCGFPPRIVRGRLCAGNTMALRRPHKVDEKRRLRPTAPG